MKRLKTTNKNKTRKKFIFKLPKGSWENKWTTATRTNNNSNAQETDLLLIKKYAHTHTHNVLLKTLFSIPITFHFYTFNFCSIGIIRYWTESKNYYLEYNGGRMRGKKQSRKLIIFIFQRGRHVGTGEKNRKKTLPQMKKWDSMKTTSGKGKQHSDESK